MTYVDKRVITPYVKRRPTPLQTIIFQKLATTGGCTIHEVATAIGKNYKSVHTAWKSLQLKKLIKKVGKKEYRGNIYDTWWLTPEGMVMALKNGEPPEIVLQNAEEIDPKSKEALRFIRELARELGEEKFRQWMIVFISYEKGDFTVKGFPLYSDMSEEDLDTFFRVAKKHSKVWRYIVKIMKRLKDTIFEEFSEEFL